MRSALNLWELRARPGAGSIGVFDNKKRKCCPGQREGSRRQECSVVRGQVGNGPSGDSMKRPDGADDGA
ncbi:MAG: hypothetical protein WA860_08765 [Acidimicrobiales bacterium]